MRFVKTIWGDCGGRGLVEAAAGFLPFSFFFLFFRENGNGKCGVFWILSTMAQQQSGLFFSFHFLYVFLIIFFTVLTHDFISILLIAFYFGVIFSFSWFSHTYILYVEMLFHWLLLLLLLLVMHNYLSLWFDLKKYFGTKKIQTTIILVNCNIIKKYLLYARTWNQ